GAGRMSAGSVGERERLARVALSRLTEPGDRRLLTLVSELDAVTVYEHLRAERELGGAATDLATRLGGIDPVRALEQAATQSIRFVVPGDAEWPPRLDDLADAEPLQERGGTPLGLWVRGPLDLASTSRSVAVVGARSATTYGCSVATEIGATCVRAGWPVVSGAAIGIDQAAHRGALGQDGPTVAVLACGVDRPYPVEHTSLIRLVATTGAVVSEAAPGWAPSRVRFLARNRLIAALAGGTVIVEAAIRSGALNTANWADRLSRTVMGVPGPVTSAQSAGVHQLLRRGASLVTSGAEVLELVDGSGAHLLEEARAPEKARDTLSVRQRQVLDAVPVTRGAEADSISRTAGVGLVEVRSTLGRLAARGLVQRTPTGWRVGEAADD
ncbi:MAG: DNA-processing protein DprA, partial [Nocardioides sp.]